MGNGQRWLRSVAEQEHLRDRDRIRMRDGQQRRLHTHAFGTRGRCSMQPELRRAKRAEDFNILPEHAARMTRAERFHCRFLGGEAPGEMRHGVPPARTIGNLTLREDTAQEPLSVSFKRAGDAWEVGGINSQSEDSHGSAPA